MLEEHPRVFQGDGSRGLSRTLVLTAVPFVLLLSSLGGSLSFVAGQGITKALSSTPHRATLPVARDRVFAVSAPQLLPVTRPLPTPAPVVARTSAPTQTLAAVHTSEAGDWVRIPSLGVEVPLARAKSMHDRDVLAALSEGVALYPNGIAPGTPGNTFISGHSTGEPWKGIYRFAFMNIDDLQPGDTILVDSAGVRYTYRMAGTRTIDPRAVPTLDSSGSTPTLTLMSCWPLWTTKNRLLVDAELIAVNPLTLQSS